MRSYHHRLMFTAPFQISCRDFAANLAALHINGLRARRRDFFSPQLICASPAHNFKYWLVSHYTICLSSCILTTSLQLDLFSIHSSVHLQLH